MQNLLLSNKLFKNEEINNNNNWNQELKICNSKVSMKNNYQLFREDLIACNFQIADFDFEKVVHV